MLHHRCTLSLATQATHLYPYQFTISLAIHCYLSPHRFHSLGSVTIYRLLHFATTYTHVRWLQPIHVYACYNTYIITCITTHTRLHLLHHMHDYICYNTYAVTFTAPHARLRLLQYIYDYICCNIYIVAFATTYTSLRLLQYVHGYVCYNHHLCVGYSALRKCHTPTPHRVHYAHLT